MRCLRISARFKSWATQNQLVRSLARVAQLDVVGREGSARIVGQSADCISGGLPFRIEIGNTHAQSNIVARKGTDARIGFARRNETQRYE